MVPVSINAFHLTQRRQALDAPVAQEYCTLLHPVSVLSATTLTLHCLEFMLAIRFEWLAGIGGHRDAKV